MKTKQINNQGKANLYFAVIVIAILFTCCSCGSRKVEKSKSVVTESQLQIDTSKTVTKIDSNIKVTDLGTIDEITFEPVDNSKPIVINGKSYLNTKLTTKKTKANIVSINNTKAVKIDKKHAISSNNKVATVETKQSDKKQFNFLSLWWLLIPIGLAIWYYKKFGFRLP